MGPLGADRRARAGGGLRDGGVGHLRQRLQGFGASARDGAGGDRAGAGAREWIFDEDRAAGGVLDLQEEQWRAAGEERAGHVSRAALAGGAGAGGGADEEHVGDGLSAPAALSAGRGDR